ncbi:MAG: succinate-semialdehyde dehydrogenase/glutarate-semialdehyde dehydrogenase [Porticoccus sp.]|jgi:succinate-semialdehyde dehydrogenase/glutarate-semialdehyde dehydrogenase
MKKTLLLHDLSLLKTQSFVDGEWISSDTGHILAVKNPANGAVIVDVAKCGATETKRMIRAASAAQKLWAKTNHRDRSKLMRKWYNLVIDNKEDLAQILTAEQGKPLAEARAEIIYGANYIEWFAEEAKRIYGDLIPEPTNDKKLFVIKQPIGVVACITPWNFPCAMLARKIAPALAAGCTVVCKPASETPLSAMALVALAERAGIPKGVINIIVGDSEEIGSELTSNPLVKKLSFTGSTAVGKKIMAASSSTVKRTSMELGGNAPFIVFDDADIDLSVQGAIASKYRNAGQTCTCANRFLIQSGVYEEFSKKLTKAVESLSLGFGVAENTSIGPLINEQAADNVCALIKDATSKGAAVLIGGGRSKLGRNFIEPTVLDNAVKGMRIFSEEIFGPVAPLFKFNTEAEAIALANDTEYGLAAYFYTLDNNRIWRVSEQLAYGIVGINESMISNEMAPFGGIKQSGQGREGSKYGLDDYLELKYICLGGLES